MCERPLAYAMGAVAELLCAQDLLSCKGIKAVSVAAPGGFLQGAFPASEVGRQLFVRDGGQLRCRCLEAVKLSLQNSKGGGQNMT